MANKHVYNKHGRNTKEYIKYFVYNYLAHISVQNGE